MNTADADRFATGAPATREALRAALARLHARGHARLLAMPAAIAVAPQGDRWSPVDHVRHLTRSTAPLVAAFRLPPWLLRLRFGAPRRPARDFDTLVADYRATLAAGGQAGRYAPPPRTVGDAAAHRRDVLLAWHRAVRALDAAVARRPDTALDAVRLPHPLLGPLSAREMLAFTVYHTAHHLRLVVARGG